ncbi:MAG: alpha/beta hydrolase [Thermoleophilaceae bacterium]
MGFLERVDPELRDGLAAFEAIELTGNELRGDHIGTVRRLARETAASVLAESPPNDRVLREDREAPGPNGDVRVRLYRPAEATEALPCLVWIHGGGMVFGAPEQDELGLDALAEQVPCVVASVEYRLAPEHPYPTPLEDCYAALLWVAETADELGVDPTRIAVGGGSAGGNLATAVALLARDRGGPAPVFQLLVYPMLDDRCATASMAEFPDSLSWTLEHTRAGWDALLGERAGGDGVDGYAAPARADDLSGLPPTLIQVGDIDVFRDEDIHYATRLLRAGVSAELHVYPGVYHAADFLVPEARSSVRMSEERIEALRGALRVSARPVPGP